MADLAIPIDDLVGAGCTWMNCTQPDGTTRYSNMRCQGDQMISVPRCLMYDFEDMSESLAALWSTGGSPDMIPLPRVTKNVWTDRLDNGSEITYTVLVIHTPPLYQGPSGASCPSSGDFGSLIVPCASTENPSAMPGAMAVGDTSPWVSRWLMENYSTKATSAPPTNDTILYPATVKSTDGLTTEAVLGIIAACIVVALGVLGFLIGRRHRSKARASQGQTGLWNDDIITANRVPREKVRIDQLISRGAFGEVYNGIYNGERVAIKMLLPSIRRDIKLVNEFLAEARLTATMDHPRIVSCIGIAWDSLSDLCVVLEFMEGGDLRTLLSNYERSRYPLGFNRQKVTIALHVAHALTYLHSLDAPVIHRDLKSRNILLNHMLEAKLTDFGISRERLDKTMTVGVGTSLWMAPEVMRGEKYDEKADMFSFGVVLSELDVHTLPYAQAKQEMQTSHGRQMLDATLLQRVAMGRVSVEFSGVGPLSIIELGRTCVSGDPSVRPSAVETLFKLQCVLSKELASNNAGN